MTYAKALRVLSRYLPYKLPLHFVRESGETHSVGTLTGLQDDGVLGVLCDNPAYNGREARYALTSVLPVLRPFKALADEIEFRGKKITPAIFLAKLALDLDEEQVEQIHKTEIRSSSQSCIEVEFWFGTKPAEKTELRDSYTVYFWRDGFANESADLLGVDFNMLPDPEERVVKNILYIVELLYEMNFAVGLQTHEFKERPC